MGCARRKIRIAVKKGRPTDVGGSKVESNLDILLRYTAIGLAYWAMGLLAFGTPVDLLALPRAIRWRAHAVVCAATVAVWPLAAVNDLRAWSRSWP